MFKDLAPAVKKETLRVAVVTAALIVIMWIAFGIGHAVSPEQIPFNYTVILGGLGGGFIAVLNFFMMGVTVQKVAGTENEDDARAKMRMSYSQRMLLQIPAVHGIIHHIDSHTLTGKVRICYRIHFLPDLLDPFEKLCVLHVNLSSPRMKGLI